MSFDGNDSNLIEWNTISPRVGLSYALDDARKTVLRASYANYAEQLAFGDGRPTENPIAVGYLAYGWNDGNDDRFVQPGEVNLNDFQYNFNIDPDNPGAVGARSTRSTATSSRSATTSSSSASTTSSAANFAVGVAYT